MRYHQTKGKSVFAVQWIGFLTEVFPDKTNVFKASYYTIKINNLFPRQMIDFNGISIHLELFYAKKLGNCIHCTILFTFFMWILKFFLCTVFLPDTNYVHIDLFDPQIWLGLVLPLWGQSESESNSNERVLHSPK